MIQKRISPLYVARPVMNGSAIVAWAKSQGLDPIPADQMHVTLIYSKAPVDWFAMGESYSPEIRVSEGGPRTVELFGSALVLRFAADELKWRQSHMIEVGASSDFDEYKPHISITYDAAGIDLTGIEPYRGEIVLGPEEFKELDPDWSGTMKSMNNDVSMQGKITKVDAKDRIAYGWFSVIEKDGKPVVDHHDDVIGEATLTKAVHEFLVDSRAGKVMHGGRRVADVVESIVFTRDVQKALGIDLGMVGWFGAMKFRDDAVWEKVEKGEFKAFSIGGTAKMKEA